MRHLFIINPVAGKGRGRQWLEQSIRTLDIPWEIAYTQGADHGLRLAREAALSGRPVRIYACGGDGTLNEVVNGAAGFDNAAVTNIPMGTGNDFLRLFGKKSKARFQDLAALSSGPQTALDLINCNGRLGINIACTGLDARIAADVHRYKSIPLVRGMGAYILSLMVNVLFKGITCPTVVDVGGLHYEGETVLICVCSGRYYGGGFMPVGDNMPDDGQLEVLVVPKVKLLPFLRMVGLYAKGRYLELPDHIWPYRENRVTIRSHRELVTVVDGEVMRSQEFVIGLSQKKVNFFYPPDLQY